MHTSINQKYNANALFHAPDNIKCFRPQLNFYVS